MPTSIPILKFRALAAIDSAAAEVRRRIITDISGQSETYAAKHAEAVKFIADRALNPSVAPGAYLLADVAENGGDAFTKASAVVAAAYSFSVLKDPMLEARRVGGKARVRLASTEEDIAAERDASILSIEALSV